jgi:hypothetical protein
MAIAEKEGTIRICGDFVELFKLNPSPRNMGAFFIAFRKRWQRKFHVLMCGLTQGGADLFRKKFDPTALVELIALKTQKQPVSFRRQGKRYVLN